MVLNQIEKGNILNRILLVFIKEWFNGLQVYPIVNLFFNMTEKESLIYSKKNHERFIQNHFLTA